MLTTLTHASVLPLCVGGPRHEVLPDGDDAKENDGQLQEAHLTCSTIVVDGVLPVGQSVNQDVVVQRTFLGVAQRVVHGHQLQHATRR